MVRGGTGTQLSSATSGHPRPCASSVADDEDRDVTPGGRGLGVVRSSSLPSSLSTTSSPAGVPGS